MQTWKGRSRSRSFIVLGCLLLAMLAGRLTAAEPLPPPEGLFDAGDYFLLRDRSALSLLRTPKEVAVKRDKALSQAAALQVAGGQGVLLSDEADGTHHIEIYKVDDAALAARNLEARNDRSGGIASTGILVHRVECRTANDQ